MHELSIAISILETAEIEAERLAATGVRAIHLRLGPLSGVVKRALVSAFELAREDSPFASCILVIEDTPLVGYCTTCAVERAVQSPQQLTCTACGTAIAEITSGRELEIAAMEIDS